MKVLLLTSSLALGGGSELNRLLLRPLAGNLGLVLTLFPLDTIVAHPCEPKLGVLGPSGVLVHILGKQLLNIASHHRSNGSHVSLVACATGCT